MGYDCMHIHKSVDATSQLKKLNNSVSNFFCQALVSTLLYIAKESIINNYIEILTELE